MLVAFQFLYFPQGEDAPDGAPLLDIFSNYYRFCSPS